MQREQRASGGAEGERERHVRHTGESVEQENINMADDDDFAAFQAEIAELKEDGGGGGGGGGEGEDDEPEEKSFVDDDGTTYVWDPSTRKFKPEGEDVAAAPAPVVPPPVQWSEEDMVFEDDEAPAMPSLKAAKKAIEMARDPDGDGGGGGGGGGGAGGSGAGAGAGASGGGASEEGTGGDGDEKKEKKLSAMAETAIEKEKERRAKRTANAPPEGWFQLKTNTSVYVTGLPDDCDAEEVKEVFSKCGVVKIDPGKGGSSTSNSTSTSTSISISTSTSTSTSTSIPINIPSTHRTTCE